MAEYWAREEKVEAIQWLDDNYDQLVDMLIDKYQINELPFGYATDPEVTAEIRTTRSGWQGVRHGDYIYLNGLGEVCVASERDFTYRYYRRPL